MQFDKIKSLQDDIRKTCAVGSGEENLAKNRSEEVIPFDRNRVILTPIPGRDHSTYVNASFIEGYDNHESFIIAQDPLESTIGEIHNSYDEMEKKEQNLNENYFLLVRWLLADDLWTKHSDDCDDVGDWWCE